MSPHSFDHGKMDTHVLVRLADEGIPVRAIARALGKIEGAVSEALRRAVSQGKLSRMPPLDWPEGTRAHNRQPSVEPVDTARVNAAARVLRNAFAIPTGQSKVLALLAVNGETGKPTIQAVACPKATHSKSVEAQICNIRAAVTYQGIEIVTRFGSGYALTPASRSRLLALIEHAEKEQRSAVSAVR